MHSNTYFASWLCLGGFTLTGSGDGKNVIDLGNKSRALRLFVTEDTGGWSQSQTLGHVQWAQAHNMLPHCIIGHRLQEGTTAFNAVSFQAFVFSWLEKLYSMGVMGARIEVGNELDVAPNWLTSRSGGDIAFNAYMPLYQACSDAMLEFRASHEDTDYRLGGAASATGGSFTYRVLQESTRRGLIMDFASWHFYAYSMQIESIWSDIRSIKASFDVPVILTEVGYDPWGKMNSMEDAGAAINEFLISAQSLGVDDMFWLSTYNSEGAGIWVDLKTTKLSVVGKVIMGFIS